MHKQRTRPCRYIRARRLPNHDICLRSIVGPQERPHHRASSFRRCGLSARLLHHLSRFLSCSVEHALYVPPPRTFGTPDRPFNQTLLHPVRQLPPLSHLRVIAHALHVVCESITHIHKCGEEYVCSRVVEYRICISSALVTAIWTVGSYSHGSRTPGSASALRATRSRDTPCTVAQTQAAA
jgi:hypothetical protein